MRVCAADESVLEWIYTVLLFDNQTALDGVANIVLGDRAECILARLARLP